MLGEMFDAQDNGDDELLSVPDVEVAAPTSKARPKSKPKAKGKVMPCPESEVVDASMPIDPDAGGDQANIDRTTAKGQRKAPQSKRGKGKVTAKSKEIVSDAEDDEFVTSQLDSIAEATSRNKQATKSSQIRSPQPGSKRRPSLGSPQSPGKGCKRTRKGTVGDVDPRSSTAVTRTKGKPRSVRVDIEASDSSANLTLVLAAAQLRVQDPPSVPNTPDVEMADTNQVLGQLNTPGGQNDPDQDEEMAAMALCDPESLHPPSSPLTELASQGNETRENDVHYTMPHRPVAGSSSRPTSSAAPRAAALPLMGQLHAGSLAKNRDGSGNVKSKAKAHSKRPPKAK